MIRKNGLNRLNGLTFTAGGAAAAALLALSACATPEAPADAASASADAKPKANCVRAEAQTGSMLSKRCGPALSDEDKRRMADEVGNRVKPSGTTAPGR